MKFLSICILSFVLCSKTAQAENWPFWRGPTRQGISHEKGLPIHWSQTSNVVWKAAIPGESWSSPIVHGDSVFITTTTGSGVRCHVLCLDRKTGETRWNQEVFQQVPRRKEGKNSYATPTPATDGQHVFAIFGDGSVVALKAASGKKVWEYREVNFYSQHGLGASPILEGDLLVMPFDASSTGENKRLGWQIPWEGSYILAFKVDTGEVSWKANRGKSRIAHVTPNMLQGELVSGAGDVVQAFDPATGRRLWSVYSQGEGVVPSIVVGNNLIYSVSGFEKPAIRAVRPPSGSNQEPEIVWEQKKGVPMIPSMLYVNELLFGITEGGVALCLNANNGEIIWQERVGGNHAASPVWIDGKIYFLSEEGESTVIRADKQFEILARNPIHERTQASMAVSHQQLFIRTANHLFCIAQP